MLLLDPGCQPFFLLAVAAWVVDMLLVLAVDVCGGSDAEAALAMLLIGAKGEDIVLRIGETRCTCAEDDNPLLGVVDVTSDGPLASTGDVCEGCGAREMQGYRYPSGVTGRGTYGYGYGSQHRYPGTCDTYPQYPPDLARHGHTPLLVTLHFVIKTNILSF